jgi:glycerophosphoryl diester phosphodiesterase
VGLTRVLAHRGSAGAHPENSLGAFAEARRLGADGVELDVRRSADGALVVAHDPVLEGLGPIAGLSVARLPEEVPLLGAALEACSGMFVNVELKADFLGSPIEAESFAAEVLACSLEVLDCEDLVFSSFDPSLLSALRRLDESVALGWLLGYAQGPAELVGDALEAASLELNVWTVNAAADLAWLFEAGVESVITDDVALARSIQLGRPEGS